MLRVHRGPPQHSRCITDTVISAAGTLPLSQPASPKLDMRAHHPESVMSLGFKIKRFSADREQDAGVQDHNPPQSAFLCFDLWGGVSIDNDTGFVDYNVFLLDVDA